MNAATQNLKFEYNVMPCYAHIKVTGMENLTNSQSIVKYCMDKATKDGFKRLLLEEQLEGSLSQSEMIKLCLLALKISLNNKIYFKIAHLAIKDNQVSDGGFAETFLRNRGVNIKHFKSKNAALEWLEND
jgi:hypothetical protein